MRGEGDKGNRGAGNRIEQTVSMGSEYGSKGGHRAGALTVHKRWLARRPDVGERNGIITHTEQCARLGHAARTVPVGHLEHQLERQSCSPRPVETR